MQVSEYFKKQIIIIAESDESIAAEIQDYLNDQGFVCCQIVNDGNQLYEVLRRYYEQPNQLGVIIANAQLPQAQLAEMSRTLTSDNESIVVPFIIYNHQMGVIQGSDNTNYRGLVHYMAAPIDYSKLLLILNFQLVIKHEHSRRQTQKEQLINELAERKIVDAKLQYLVVHDELTGLLNRQNFERQLRLILNRNSRIALHGALLFIDVDRFSLINELEDFEVGDRLLVDIVAIIRQNSTSDKLFARIGSDEFCLFVEGKSDRQVREIAEHIRKSVYGTRFLTGDVCYSISISLGMASLQAVTALINPRELISRARQACTMAKHNGRNMLWEYNEKDNQVQERNKDIYWVPLIKKALVDKRFFLVFQPVVNLDSGYISHYEVLVRMRGEANEVIAPVNFIPVAERMGLIHSIDLLVVEKAIDWLAKQDKTISVAINLSSVAFQDDSLLPTIKEKLALNWVSAERITFEITETAAIDNFEQTRAMIIKIRALGCRFALDDFGAGFCSFNYLKKFPVDYVKIDGQFISNLLNDETDQVLVKSMTEIAKQLGKKTIAEFVETDELVVKLREIGVDFGQGYLFGKPEVNLIEAGRVVLTDLTKEKKRHNNLTNLY